MINICLTTSKRRLRVWLFFIPNAKLIPKQCTKSLEKLVLTLPITTLINWNVNNSVPIVSSYCIAESFFVWVSSFLVSLSTMWHLRFLKGAVAKFGLLFYLPTNFSEIFTQYVKSNQESIFAISFIYLIFSCWLSHFFR